MGKKRIKFLFLFLYLVIETEKIIKEIETIGLMYFNHGKPYKCMKILILLLLFIFNNREYLSFIVTVTVYNACESQCDDDPFITADGSVIDPEDIENLNWIAVSQDLLMKGLNYGDVVELICPSDPSINGFYEIHDCMNKRYTNYVDILVPEHIKTGKWENVEIKKLKERI